MKPLSGSNKTNPIEANTMPKQSQNEPNQTRSEFIPKGAEIPTGGLLGILKPGTNFKRGIYAALRSVAQSYGLLTEDKFARNDGKQD